ncbi:MAG: DUF72 domain-containing protein, partial [Actinobacteria bacterium]|nr:DUF72 domain-containing protein [Actinomycetota bacterium]
MIWIGTSGWQYAHWKERFYPKGLPQKAWLEYFVERFPTVEINNSFYMTPKPASYEGWRDRTPEGFVFAVKAHRYITHIKRLKDPEESVERFMSGARLLGPKLGPVLYQFPPNFAAEPVPERLRGRRGPDHRSRHGNDTAHDGAPDDDTAHDGAPDDDPAADDASPEFAAA